MDKICMWMAKNPEWFDVIVTEIIFGDIITDIGARIQGGIGMSASKIGKLTVRLIFES